LYSRLLLPRGLNSFELTLEHTNVSYLVKPSKAPYIYGTSNSSATHAQGLSPVPNKGDPLAGRAHLWLTNGGQLVGYVLSPLGQAFALVAHTGVNPQYNSSKHPFHGTPTCVLSLLSTQLRPKAADQLGRHLRVRREYGMFRAQHGDRVISHSATEWF